MAFQVAAAAIGNRAVRAALLPLALQRTMGDG